MSEQVERASGGAKVVGVAVRLAANRYVAVAVLAVGAVSAVVAMRRQGVDAQWPYLYAHGMWTGDPIFSSEWRDANLEAVTGYTTTFGLFWPAAMGIVMLPLAALSFETARVLQVLVYVGAMVAGVWALFALARPRTTWPTRLTVAGLILLMACARWCWTPVQFAPLLAGLLVAVLHGLHRGRVWMAVVATTLVIALKPTLCIPFVLLLLLHRRYKAIAVAFAANIILNVIAFARMGGLDAIDGYREGTKTLEQRGGINTPDFWEHISIPRIDGTYLVTGLTGSFGLGRAVALLAGGAITLFLIVACLRMAQPPSLADSARIMLAGTCVGLIIVYHHHYDLALLIPGLLLIALLHRELRLSWSRWVAWSFVPLSFLMVFVPASAGANAAEAVIGERGPGLFNALFPISTTLALAGSLALVMDSTGSLAEWRSWLTASRRRGVPQPVA